MALSEAQSAIRFAKAYVQLVEALMREGVAEAVAREEAHRAALVDARLEEEVLHYDPARGPCPGCGRG